MARILDEEAEVPIAGKVDSSWIWKTLLALTTYEGRPPRAQVVALEGPSVGGRQVRPRKEANRCR